MLTYGQMISAQRSHSASRSAGLSGRVMAPSRFNRRFPSPVSL